MRLRLTTAKDVRRSLSRITNGILNGEIEPKIGNSAIYACNAILQSIRTDEQEKRISEIEKALVSVPNYN